MSTLAPYYDECGVTLYQGDALEVLRTLPSASVNCCVTSPPYWGLRDYGVGGQLGLEGTPGEYVAAMVAVFQEVRRVLRADGTVWLNLGDSYNAYNGGAGPSSALSRGAQTTERPQLPSGYGLRVKNDKTKQATNAASDFDAPHRAAVRGVKAKDLIGIPWAVAFALRADGWYLRQDIIWSKPNPMPESVTDRCTKAHEYIFLLSKSARYFYNAEAVMEDGTGCSGGAAFGKVNLDGPGSRRISDEDNARIRGGKHRAADPQSAGHRMVENTAIARANGGEHDSPFGPKRNRRSVWTVTTSPFPEAHFATFPPDLIKPCILAGCPNDGVCLDPFYGAGTTGEVCRAQHVRCIGIELNPTYCDIAVRRHAQGVLPFNGKAGAA